MNKVVDELISQGLIIEDVQNTIDYLSYNTSWKMLKPSRNMLEGFTNDAYVAVTFSDIRHAGLVDYYFNMSYDMLVRNFEHQLKVHISREYQLLSESEKFHLNKEIKDEKLEKYCNDNKVCNLLNANDFDCLDVFYFASLYELVNIYNDNFNNTMNYKYVNKNIKNIRNYLYHHRNILEFRDENYIENKRINQNKINKYEKIFDISFDKKEKKFLKNHGSRSNIFLILALIDNVEYFLNQSVHTRKMYQYTLKNFNSNYQKSKYYFNKGSEKKEWAKLYFSILDKLILNFEENNLI